MAVIGQDMRGQDAGGPRLVLQLVDQRIGRRAVVVAARIPLLRSDHGAHEMFDPVRDLFSAFGRHG